MSVNGISFDGVHSYNDLGLWLSQRPDLGLPSPKTNIVDVPGMDGVIDLTEANAGEVKFENRTLVFTFAAMVDFSDQMAFKSAIRNALHGKKFERIILDEDPEWYWSGRATVEFTDVNDWRLIVAVTVDAAPYAMKTAETVVDLNPTSSSEFEARRILRATNTYNYANSQFLLGSREFPTGCVFEGTGQLIIAWPETALYRNVRYVNIADSDGNVANFTISAPMSAGEVRIAVSDINNAGVNANKVWRILVSGIGDCALYSEEVCAHVRVWNERKNVCPLWTYDGSVDITITVNDSDYVIEEHIKNQQYDEIWLKQGWNDIYIPFDLDNQIRELSILFWEGKL